MKRSRLGGKIIGKIKQVDYDKFMLIKTDLGYYPRIKGKSIHSIGHRHKTVAAARKELNMWISAAKEAKASMR